MIFHLGLFFPGLQLIHVQPTDMLLKSDFTFFFCFPFSFSFGEIGGSSGNPFDYKKDISILQTFNYRSDVYHCVEYPFDFINILWLNVHCRWRVLKTKEGQFSFWSKSFHKLLIKRQLTEIFIIISPFSNFHDLENHAINQLHAIWLLGHSLLVIFALRFSISLNENQRERTE